MNLNISHNGFFSINIVNVLKEYYNMKKVKKNNSSNILVCLKNGFILYFEE